MYVRLVTHASNVLLFVFSAKGRLIDLIKAKDFKAAISLYRAIEKLSAAERPKDKADDADEETDEVDDDNDDDDDKSDDRSESLSKEEKKLLNGLRNIFLGKKHSLVLLINMPVSLCCICYSFVCIYHIEFFHSENLFSTPTRNLLRSTSGHDFEKRCLKNYSC